MMWHWDNAPIEELRDFAIANSLGNATATNVPTLPTPFRHYAANVLDRLGYEVNHWRYWVATLGGGIKSRYGVRTHDDNPQSDEWEDKFPHCHGWDGRTVVLQLSPPEEGGEFVYFEDDQWTERHRITPKAGACTLIRDHEWHGVRAVQGDRPRIAMMAGAYPYPMTAFRCQCGTKPVKERKPCPAR